MIEIIMMGIVWAFMIFMLGGLSYGIARSFYMPGFWKRMPKADDEPNTLFMAVVIRTNPFNGGGEVWWKLVRGKRKAYLAARWSALMWDWNTPYADGELGIDWALRPPTEDELNGRRS